MALRQPEPKKPPERATAAAAPTQKGAASDIAKLFIPFDDLQKAEQRIVEGIASTEAIDNQPGVMDGTPYIGDVVDPGAVEGALEDYLEWANVREMHQPSAVGTAIAAKVLDGKLHLAVKVVDDSAWNKVVTKVYKGFSIGGRALKAVLEQLPDGRYIRRILKLMLTEISLVDRPANPEARILVFKGIEMADTPTVGLSAQGITADQLAELQKLAGTLDLSKASADPAKCVQMCQALRNDAELAGDLDGASLYTQAIGLILQASGDADETAADDELAADDAEVAAAPPDMAMALSQRTELIKQAYPNLSEVGVAELAKAGYAPLELITVRKASRMLSGTNMAAVEGVWKALGEMLIRAGNEKVAAVMKAYGADEGGGDALAMSVKAIGAELTKAIEPIAGAVLSLASDVEVLKRQPLPGGPVLRPVPVPKQIGAQVVEKVDKPAASTLVREQLDNLLRKANTDPNPAFRLEYRKQYDALREQYA